MKLQIPSVTLRHHLDRVSNWICNFTPSSRSGSRRRHVPSYTVALEFSGDPVLAWLDEIDLYLQPSFQEGLPRAAIEAMSRACPVLGSTAGGIDELIQGDCLHRPGDVATLSSHILQCFRNTDLQLRMARENFETSHRYSMEVLSKKRFEFWSRVAAAAGRERAGCAG